MSTPHHPLNGAGTAGRIESLAERAARGAALFQDGDAPPEPDVRRGDRKAPAPRSQPAEVASGRQERAALPEAGTPRVGGNQPGAPLPDVSLRRQLVVLASRLLASEGEDVLELEVVVRTLDRASRHVLRSRPGDFAPVLPPGLTAVQRRVYDVLTETCQPLKVITKLAGYKSQPYVSAALSALCRAGVAEHIPQFGFRRLPEC